MNQQDFYDKVKERFIRYVQVNTTSEANCPRTPTTQCQFDLARMLEKELTEIGVQNVWLDEAHCIVYGTVPSTMKEGQGKSIGFIAHMDTSPDVPGAHVKPWVCENYQGNDVVLNAEANIVMSVSEYPNLKKYIGQDIVFTDGTTLLGGDDKAAIAAVMTMAEYFVDHPEIAHGPVQIAFTPDEEVGGLAKDLDFERFGAELAYTVDGDDVGYYSYETFNATEAQILIHGLNVHPGTAKGIMINAVEVGAELIAMLPGLERPRYTEGREGYFHPHLFEGNVENAKVFCLIRDHDDERFEERMAYIEKCVQELRARYGQERIELQFANGYRSMRKVVEPVMYMIDDLKEAIAASGVEPVCLAFRGGTDGSSISQRGLPCPNISAGYENGHSRFEFVPVQSMAKNVEILIRLCEKFAKSFKNY